MATSPLDHRKSGTLFRGLFMSASAKKLIHLESEKEERESNRGDETMYRTLSRDARDGKNPDPGSSQKGRNRTSWSLLNPMGASSRRLSFDAKKSAVSEREVTSEKEEPSNEPFSSSVQFLTDGFLELFKCRQVTPLVNNSRL
jgi:hypothetical protein